MNITHKVLRKMIREVLSETDANAPPSDVDEKAVSALVGKLKSDKFLDGVDKTQFGKAINGIIKKEKLEPLALAALGKVFYNLIESDDTSAIDRIAKLLKNTAPRKNK